MHSFSFPKHHLQHGQSKLWMIEEGPSTGGIPKNITQLAQRKIRLAKAQAEVDRILNCPIDPPFDAESEMKKVVSISPPLVAENSIDYAREELISEMEAEVYEAVKQQDFVKAAEKETIISQKHVDDCGLVLQANSRFYDAFGKKDFDAMQAVWLQDQSCICIHPSHKPLVRPSMKVFAFCPLVLLTHEYRRLEQETLCKVGVICSKLPTVAFNGVGWNHRKLESP